MLENVKISSGQFWMSAVITAMTDLIFIAILIWRMKSSHFRDLQWILVGAAALFWSTFGIFLMVAFWDTYYHHFFPNWFRSGGILLFVPTLFGAFALAFHVPGNPIVTFCLLGGTESLVEHLWAFVTSRFLKSPSCKKPALHQSLPLPSRNTSFTGALFSVSPHWSNVVANGLQNNNEPE